MGADRLRLDVRRGFEQEPEAVRNAIDFAQRFKSKTSRVNRVFVDPKVVIVGRSEGVLSETNGFDSVTANGIMNDTARRFPDILPGTLGRADIFGSLNPNVKGPRYIGYWLSDELSGQLVSERLAFADAFDLRLDVARYKGRVTLAMTGEFAAANVLMQAFNKVAENTDPTLVFDKMSARVRVG